MTAAPVEVPLSPEGPSHLPAGCWRARAYCREAHHREWTMQGEPPEEVELRLPDGVVRYRLVRHPRTGEAAIDHGGALVFVPARDG